MLTSYINFYESIYNENTVLKVNFGSTNYKQLSISTNISNNTIINGKTLFFNSSLEIMTDGNLTIINSNLTFNSSIDAIVLKETGAILEIRNSFIENGVKAISNDLNAISGVVTLDNVTFNGFTNNVIDLNGNFKNNFNDLIILNNGRTGIQLDGAVFQSNITNSIISGVDKNAINASNSNIFISNIIISLIDEEGIKFESLTQNIDFIIKDSRIFGSGGDAIKVLGSSSTEVAVLVENVTITNSHAQGIYASNITNLTVKDSTIKDSAYNGLEVSQIEDLSLYNVSLSGNGLASIGGSGILIKNTENFSTNSINSTNNEHYGIEVINSSVITIFGSAIIENGFGGLNLTNIGNANIFSSKFLNSTGTDSAGVTAQNVSSLVINDSESSNNNGSGFKIDSVNGTLFNNQIKQNKNGIEVYNQSNIEIFNNSVSSNLNQGIFFDSTGNGTIRYNNITDNKGYGLFVTENNINIDVIDANLNYWGSDSGPLLKINEEGIQDDYNGVVKITSILRSDGSSSSYSLPQVITSSQVISSSQVLPPPQTSEIDYQFILTVIAIIGALLIAGSSGYYQYLKRKWIRTTKPQLILLISNNGLPIASHDFAKIGQDDAVLAGFISAINSFSSSLLQSKDDSQTSKTTIQEIRHESFTLLTRKLGDNLLVLVVNESNPLIKQRLDLIVRDLTEELKLINKSNEQNLIDTDDYDEIIPKISTKHLKDLSTSEN
ncbi:MAG: right-handed parallel beta-helix repeat-containing protein [Candidatus Hodarchaeales archaeon]